MLAASCGADTGAAGSDALRIESAQWRGGPEPGAVVSGEWRIGVSTPPSCTLLEGEDGESVDWYATGDRVELERGRFRREFVRLPESGGPGLDPKTEYYVRCRVSIDTGKTIESVAPIAGEVPAP